MRWELQQHYNWARERMRAAEARVTELEGVLFTANEDKDEWRQSAEAWERSAKERLERATTAEHRIEELTAERDEAQDRIVGLETDKAHGMCLGCTTHIAALSAQVEAYRDAAESQVRIADDRLATAHIGTGPWKRQRGNALMPRRTCGSMSAPTRGAATHL